MIWQTYILYFKPVIILFNVVPFFFFLVLYARLLDRFAVNDWAWFVGLFAASWGNYLVVFNASLNNHTVAAYSAFFALYAFTKIEESGSSSEWPTAKIRPGKARPRAKSVDFAAAGFWAAFCACNEIPAGLFGALLFLLVLARDARRTALFFVPAAIVPLAAFFATQYLAFGQLKPVYEEFGTKSYTYEGSYWNTPAGVRLVQPVPRAEGPLPVPHDLRPPRGLLALADLPVLDLREPAEHARQGAAAQGDLVADVRPDGRDARVLHLEPQGEELRRLDLRASAGSSG